MLQIVKFVIQLFFFDIAQIFGCRNASHTSFDHRRGCFLDSGYITGYKYARQRGSSVLIADRNLSAAFWVILHFAACHFQQLGHRRKSDSQADCINIEMLFCSRNELKMGIHLGNGHSGHTFLAFCTDDGVGKIERNSSPCYLCRMYAVSADSRRRIYQAYNLTAALQKLEGNHQTYVAGAKHQNLLAWKHAVQVHHRLGCTSTNDSRKRPAREGNHVFRCACGDQNRVSFVVKDLFTLLYDNLFVLIQADHGGI